MAECSVCNDKFENIQFLACLHAVCSQCLEDLKKFAQETNQPAACRSCGDKIDFARLVTIGNESVGAKISGECPNHGGEKLVGFCEKCRAIVCQKCVTHQHDTHAITRLDEAATKLRDALALESAKLEERAELLKNTLNEIDSIRLGITNQRTLIQSRLTHEFEIFLKNEPHFQSQLTSRRDTLVASANKDLDADAKNLQLQRETIEMIHEWFVVACTQCKVALESARNVVFSDPAVSASALKDFLVIDARLAELRSTKPVLVPVVKNSINLYLPEVLETENIASLGTFYRLGDRNYAEIKLPQRVFSGPANSPPFLVNPTGIIATPDGNMAVCDHKSRRVRIINQNGEPVRDIRVSVKPFFAALSSDGCLWVSDAELSQVIGYSYSTGAQLQKFFFNAVWGIGVRSNGDVVASNGTTVQCFTSNGKQRWLATGVELRGCRGLFVSPSDEVYVCDGEGENSALQIFSGADGKHLRSLGDKRLKKPNAVTITSSGDIIVSDARNNLLTFFKPSGAISSFGSRGQGPGQFDGSFGVTCFPDDRIAVTDQFNNRIHIF